MSDPSTTAVEDPAPATEPVLIVVGGWSTRRYPLPRSGRVILGRAPDADVVLEEPSVSRHHAALELGATLAIEDLGSANGTRVHGAPVRGRVPLEWGAPAQLGPATVFVMRDRTRVPAVPSSSGPVFVSPRMRALVHVLERVALGEVGVLLLGETGSGKEVLAELLHARSRRADGPLVAVNCAALPDGLVEAELFGHERGAFTGAVGSHAGLFEQASGGTLFLDEVGELTAPAQAKLLRVLEERSVRAIGGDAPTPVDVRIVAATHRDLRDCAAFRSDLYYRLAGMVVAVPPLRERRDDILPLATRFLERAAAAANVPARTLGDAARAWLLAQPWPGNVRELRNAIECASLLCDGGTIEIAHLTGDPFGAVPPADASLRTSVADVERARIGAMLDECRWNQSEAARRLGISRNTLAARIRAHGLRRGEPT